MRGWLKIMIICGIGLIQESTAGSICLGANLSKAPIKTWVQVNDSKLFQNPSFPGVKVVLDNLDEKSEHMAKIFIEREGKKSPGEFLEV